MQSGFFFLFTRIIPTIIVIISFLIDPLYLRAVVIVAAVAVHERVANATTRGTYLIKPYVLTTRFDCALSITYSTQSRLLRGAAHSYTRFSSGFFLLSIRNLCAPRAMAIGDVSASFRYFFCFSGTSHVTTLIFYRLPVGNQTRFVVALLSPGPSIGFRNRVYEIERRRIHRELGGSVVTKLVNRVRDHADVFTNTALASLLAPPVIDRRSRAVRPVPFRSHLSSGRRTVDSGRRWRTCPNPRRSVDALPLEGTSKRILFAVYTQPFLIVRPRPYLPRTHLILMSSARPD